MRTLWWIPVYGLWRSWCLYRRYRGTVHRRFFFEDLQIATVITISSLAVGATIIIIWNL